MIRTALRTIFALTIATSATLITIAGSAAPVSATEVAASDVATRTVATAGIDLATPEGRATVTARVRRAAAAVCNPGDASLRAAMARRACTATAIAAATPRIEDLAAAHTGRNSLAGAAEPTSILVR